MDYNINDEFVKIDLLSELKDGKLKGVYPLAANLLESFSKQNSFLEWIDSLEEQLIEDCVDKLDQEDAQVNQDVFLAGILWMGKFKGDLFASHDEKEVWFITKLIPALLSQLSVVNTIKKELGDGIPKIFKLRAKDNNTWHPDEIFLDSYLEVKSYKGTKVSGEFSDKPQKTYSLTQLAYLIIKEKYGMD